MSDVLLKVTMNIIKTASHRFELGYLVCNNAIKGANSSDAE